MSGPRLGDLCAGAPPRSAPGPRRLCDGVCLPEGRDCGQVGLGAYQLLCVEYALGSVLAAAVVRWEERMETSARRQTCGGAAFTRNQ